MAAYTDLSIMPIGQYKGTVMANVPAKYLLWLHGKGIHPKYTDLKNYIESNKDVLKKETKRK